MTSTALATAFLASVLTAAPHAGTLAKFDILQSVHHSNPVILVSDSGGSMSHDKMMVHKVGTLEISQPTVRATPPNAPVSGGYLTIKNTGSEADRLLGGSAAFAGKVEVHEMKMDGDIMKMREVEGGLEIPPGGEVVLKPGGLHIMFMKLSEQMTEGEMRIVTLEFEKAGTIELEFAVKDVKSGHGSMKH